MYVNTSNHTLSGGIFITSMPVFATIVSARQQQVPSEGGGGDLLTASLNGASFTKGDTVIISGNVEETSTRSNV